MAEKQWYFDPSKPAEVPECLHDVLEKRGIPQSEIKLCIMTDLYGGHIVLHGNV